MATLWKVVLLIAGFGSCVQGATHNYRPLKYTIPRPLIQAFRPKGLKVSIPHIPGIQLFAFHANINKPLDENEQGEMAQDIRKRDGDSWVFENSTVKLRLGDKIHYRAYVIKNRLGYRLQNGVHEISKLNTFEDLPTTTPPVSTTVDSTDEGYNICVNVVLNLTQNLIALQEETDSLKERNDILRDMVKRFEDVSRTLTLEGVRVEDDELVPIVQAIIHERLHLPFRVANVRRTSGGLVKFEVGSVDEKVEVVRAAKMLLRHSKFSITY